MHAPINRIGLGAWQLGADWADLTDEQAAEILLTAQKEGIDFIDTADVYGAGLSESRIGVHMQKTGHRPFIATKLGRLHGYPDGYSKALFEQCCHDSMERLGLDVLDLVQLHCIPTDRLREGNVFDWLREIKKEGLIRDFGASVESTEEARLCLKQPGLASLQIIFNVLRPNPISEIFEECQSKGIKLIARLPLASGLLAGKFTSKSTFPESDHRQYNRNGEVFNVGETFAGLPFDVGVSLSEELGELFPQKGTMAQQSLRWILDHPAISVVIPGASRPEHVKSNSAANTLKPLGKRMHDELMIWSKNKSEPHIRGPR